MADLATYLQRFVKRLNNHSPLAREERQAILDLPGKCRDVVANEDIVGTGEHVRHAFLIADGVVGSFGQTSGGSRQITALHILGDMAGLQSVVQPDNSLGLQALSQASVCRISHQSLRELTSAFPAIAEAFWRQGAIEAAMLAQWVVNLGRLDALGRLAHLLCEMSLRYGGPFGRQSGFDFPVTQAHLADLLGLTPIHVNRTIRALRTEGFATITGRRVEIRDWSRLAARAEFDPAYLHLVAVEDGYHGIVATA